MTNDEYTSLVHEEKYPENRMVPLDSPFSDSRGTIQNLVLKPVTSVASITSKKGSVRANHYHKSDTHYCYLVSGKIYYFERPVGSSEIPEPIVINPGEMFFTPPMVEHAMLFAEDSVMITMAKNVRSHESHESDLVRVEFVTDKIASDFIISHEFFNPPTVSIRV